MDTNTGDGKKYEVRKYFDDHYEGVAGKDLSEQDANDLAKKLNSQPRAYVNYSVHPQLNPTAK